MSDMTLCNFCGLQNIKGYAAIDGMKVVILPGWNNGTEIFTVPPEISKKDLNDMSEVDRNKYFIAWFMELTDQCCC